MAVEIIKKVTRGRKAWRCAARYPERSVFDQECGLKIEPGELHYQSSLRLGGSEFPENRKICEACFMAGRRQSVNARLILEGGATLPAAFSTTS